MRAKLKQIVSDPRYITGLYVLVAILISVQALLLGGKRYEEAGKEYNRYNNYTIFERSFYHLKNNQDLYVYYPEEHWDIYKYTPTFSVFFGLFAVFPDWLGLPFWNLFNAVPLLVGIYYLPKLNNFEKGLVAIIILQELITSIQNEQANGLIAGLLILAFALMERKKYAWATLCIVSSAFIKLFGIVGVALYLLYPNKRHTLVYTMLWVALMAVVPLVLISYEQYVYLLENYLVLLSDDHSASYGYSVMGWLYTWFMIGINKMAVVLIGAAIFMVPFMKIQWYTYYGFRYLVIVSILIWVVIFNHKAESPTFIIAMAGVAMWFVVSEKNAINIALFTFAFVFTTLSPTDIFPQFLREQLVTPYVLKGVPCIFVWIKVIYDMLSKHKVSYLTNRYIASFE
ncbi:glycosyltransferase 87 family protein [Tunicatimonas pelagia]|uniref:glycosyltransferase 87 family protein n=1 Tax=Tunicatimonas pelagia TaxID=931531 RepID=UPI00266628D8|nr:glycosyltransferase 87 family protein [Tunicatimonas pelagia]WKN41941.1 glycosyltransferase 87 family protein [Tunicatimonas pelagia]